MQFNFTANLLFFDKSIKFIGCKINLNGKYIEIITIKAIKKVDVKEIVEGELIYYKINYKDDIVFYK